ncbi:MAG TPA: putative Ig domain-containing protein [Vicinamibacterales bacterium]|nr:putative Ig domain-containing protein [Vicinamibacterales bacterium]
MRICGKQVVVLVLATLALAGCGGEDSTGSGATNAPPIIAGSPATALSAGSSYSFTPTAADPDGDALTFHATGVPSWATFNASTGALTGTPSESHVGMSEMITIEVSDTKAIAQLPAFRIQVSSQAQTPPPVNVAPSISGSAAITATVGQTYTFQPVGQDANGDALVYSIANRPNWLTFTPSTGRVSGTPTTTDVGATGNIIITVTDGSLSATLTFAITVQNTAPVNRAPTITGTPTTTITAGTAYNFAPVGSDPDGNSLTYSIQNQPSWSTFNASTGRLSGTPGAGNVGTSGRITITVSDGTLTASLPSFTIQVNAQANRVPTISGSPLLSILVGLGYSFQPTASDADGNTLTFSIQNRPSWATFNTATGRLSGTPGLLDIATTTNIVISVSDGTATASLSPFSLAVLQTSTGNATVSWTPPTANTDGTALTDLASYRIVYGRDPANLNLSDDEANPTATSHTVNNLTSGTWHFAVIVVNAAGAESVVSNVATKTVN